MTDPEKHKYCICKVPVNAKDLIHGLPLPAGTEIIRIVPNMDKLEFLEDHWLWLRHEDLPEIDKTSHIPIRHIIVELVERSMGPYTVMMQKVARFSEEMK